MSFDNKDKNDNSNSSDDDRDYIDTSPPSSQSNGDPLRNVSSKNNDTEV